jgi:hypothetical protein
VHLIVRTLIERREGLAAFRGQGEMALACVVLAAGPHDQALLLEALNDPTEIAVIEAKLGDKIARGRVVALRQFVEHAPF